MPRLIPYDLYVPLPALAADHSGQLLTITLRNHPGASVSQGQQTQRREAHLRWVEERGEGVSHVGKGRFGQVQLLPVTILSTKT